MSVSPEPTGVSRGSSSGRSLLRVFGRPEEVLIPEPFGRRRVYDFDSPEVDLFPALLGVGEVRVKVGFESRLATRALAALAGLAGLARRAGFAELARRAGFAALAGFAELAGGGSGSRARAAAGVAALGRAGSWLGHSGGAVLAEVWFEDGSRCAASLSTPEDGQRMAALPCALAARALLHAEGGPRGAATVYELLGARPLVQALEREGFRYSLSR